MILSLNSVVRNWWPYWWISRPIFLSTKNVCKHLMTSKYKLLVEQSYDEQCPSNTKKWSTEPSYLNDSEAFICIVVMFFQPNVMTIFYSDIIDFKIMWHNFLQISTPHSIHKQSGADLHTSHNYFLHVMVSTDGKGCLDSWSSSVEVPPNLKHWYIS